MTFKEYKGLDLVSVGNEILDRWKKNHAFEKSLEVREGCPEFIFFEGPPSANGKPGIHHVMARSIKDAICRYKTQSGYKVNRRAGWDTHGLPVELGVEKKLGITKADIGPKIGIAEYNDTCRSEVMKYTEEWRNMTERVGYWVDMDDPYITYDNRYIETLWYLLKKIYDKGLLYKGYTIQPYSPTDGTGLSSHELNQPGCYKDVTDTTVTCQFEVIDDENSRKLRSAEEDVPVYFLAWTTTPWTLPSNTALCVGPSIDYVRVLSFNPYTGAKAVYVLAKALVGAWFNPKGADAPMEYSQGDKVVPYRILEGEFKGSDLVGIRYRQLIGWFSPVEGDAFRVISGDYVTTEDGTGVVHIAPTFGADDKKVATNFGIPGIMPVDRDGNPQAQVDRQGRFCRLEDLDPEYVAAHVDPSYSEYAGRYVKKGYKGYFEHNEAPDEVTLDVDLCMMLKADGRAFKIQKHVHNYPHSWRTDLPVLYYPLDSWFIKASAVKDQMVALNKTITWKPESTGTGRFGQWLENIQDWNLSRSRFWGTPLPIWRTDDGKEEICIGTVAELYSEIEKAVAAGVMDSNPLKALGFDPSDMSKENYDRIDLHRPYVDNIFLVSPSGRRMVRETDLIDVWFDSGVAAWASLGYPHHKEEFEKWWPAKFIVEAHDQTRGWFYSQLGAGVISFDRAPYDEVMMHGWVLDPKGQKMSKSLGNVIEPLELIDQVGADSLRYYLIKSNAPWEDTAFQKDGPKNARKVLNTYWNVVNFASTYMIIDGFDPEKVTLENISAHLRDEDRWMISRTEKMKRSATEFLESRELHKLARMLEDYIMEDLSRWYVCLVRDRSWSEDDDMVADKNASYFTLYYAIMNTALVLAPIAPHIAEEVYQHMGGKKLSVHMEDWPVCNNDLIDEDVEHSMSLIQNIVDIIAAERAKMKSKLR